MEAASGAADVITPAASMYEFVLETLITRVQKLTMMALAGMLIVVMVLSTVHLGVLIGQDIHALIADSRTAMTW